MQASLPECQGYPVGRECPQGHCIKLGQCFYKRVDGLLAPKMPKALCGYCYQNAPPDVLANWYHRMRVSIDGKIQKADDPPSENDDEDEDSTMDTLELETAALQGRVAALELDTNNLKKKIAEMERRLDLVYGHVFPDADFDPLCRD